MCGLCGELRLDGTPASAAGLERMSARLARRGPDGAGMLTRGPLGLAHRRLGIFDLSDRSEQPLVDSELGLSIAYNGALYNYRELRAELEERGYRFFSDGDTEVLLKAFHAFGDAALERLRGMFAFAIWERERQRLTLARDALGIKPLYLAEGPGWLRFASTLPALLAGGGIDTRIDEVALHHYLSFHSVVPAPRTILRGVRKLPPGSLLHIDADGRREERRWWSLDFDRGRLEVDEREAAELVTESLRDATRARMVADVPVGVLLSGGLDSSLIVALLAEGGQRALSTFSIGFESVGDEEGDEFRYSDVVAREFGTDHHKLRIDAQSALAAIPECVDAMSEPMVSHDVVGFYLLSREVSRHLRVVQSGQGADEVFAGYHWYPPLVAAGDPLAAYAAAFFDRDHAELGGLLAPGLTGADHARAFVAEHFARPGAERGIDKALRLDQTVMLVEDPVKRVDNTTMSFGLEARVPFLDRELVELAARLPAEHKLAEGGKGVLKRAARALLPAELIDRPKGYFPVPALKYLRGSFLELARDALQAGPARERGLFRPAAVAELLERPDEHLTPLRGSKLWQIALLELWLQRHGIPASRA